ncbi:MAG: mechanosensitive ion channel family protein [Myxococcota bacterium]
MPKPIAALLVVAALLLASAGAAQPSAPGAGATPRAAMLEYLTACREGDYTEASRYLNLRRLPPARRAEAGPPLARRFKAVLDRTLWVELDTLSDAAEGDLEDGLAPDLERVGVIEAPGESPVEVLLQRRAGEPAWRIAPTTLDTVPALAEALGVDWMEERLPAIWVETRFLEMALWQWVGLPLLMAAAALLAWLVTLLLSLVATAIAGRTEQHYDDLVVRAARAPLGLILGVLLFRPGRGFLALAVPVDRALAGVENALLVLGAAWLTLRSVDVAATFLRDRWQAAGEAGAVGLVPLGRRVAKVFLGAIAVIAMLQNLGVNVTGILAGLGVGGLAVALAAQKTVENLFGGVTLAADRPVRVGDFCRFGDKIGTIEEIGLRSTRVRTLDRTLVTVPNAEFSALPLENFAARDRIWFQTVLGLRYETTADQMRHVLAGLTRLLQDDPRVDADPARVRFVGFGAFSLDVEVFAYIRTRDWSEFLKIREELLLRIMDCVDASGSGFAFPSQTIYTAADEGLDEEKARRAIEEIRAQRAET